MIEIERFLPILRTLSGTTFSQPALLARTADLDTLAATGYLLMRESGDGLFQVWLSGRGRQAIGETPAQSAADSRLEDFIAFIWRGEVPSEKWIQERLAHREEVKAEQARLRVKLERDYRRLMAAEGR